VVFYIKLSNISTFIQNKSADLCDNCLMNLAAELALLPPSDALKIALRMLGERDQNIEQIILDKDQTIAIKEQIILDNNQIIANKEQEITDKDRIITYATATIKALESELLYKSRQRFLAKSESFTAEQRDLFNEADAIDQAAIKTELEQLADQLSDASNSPKAKRIRSGRQALPAHLTRIIHRHEPESCICAHCQADLVKISEDISEQLDVTPAQFIVHQHIRPQYACKHCETITAAPIPAAMIEGGMASTGLLTWLAIGKYADHLPLYRLEQMAARQGVVLARSTTSDWIGRIGVALQPLADRLAELIRQRSVIHADETPVSQLAPGEGKTKKAYLWAYRTADLTDQAKEQGKEQPRMVVFQYHNTRSGECARAFLQNWQGALMVDGYAGYKKLFAELGVTELGCWAHARRKFFELYQAGSPIAEEALVQIKALYAIERECTQMSCTERHAYRQEHALPKLKDFHHWLVNTRKTVAPNSGTAKALDYSIKRWAALERYSTAGHYPIDNNPVENAIRPIAIGKKNWLFAGSERAGFRAAAIQSLFATAKLNGVDPAKWLAETLEKLPTHPHSRIDELLPF
jgi:transposase